MTTVADSTGPFASFGAPSLNDPGTVVFTADPDTFGVRTFIVKATPRHLRID